MGVRNWDDLPTDVVVKILLNLPVKDAIRCSLLQKSCYSLLHSKPFVDSYNRHSRLYSTNPPLITLKFSDPLLPSHQLSLRHNNALLHEFMRLHSPLPTPLLSVSNCCHGLVCLSADNCGLVLWNPILRKTLTLPSSRFGLGLSCFLGLGFVDETSDYKVLMVNERHQVELYSLQHNSWKIIAHPKPGPGVVPDSFTLYVEGSLYWLSSKSRKIVVGVFDFKDEVFTRVSLPDGWDSCAPLSLRLRVHSESSVAAVRSVWDPRSHEIFYHIQVMDVNTCKWRKHSVVGFPRGELVDILGFNKDGDEIIKWEDYYGQNWGAVPRICTHRNGRFTNIVKPVDCVEASNYVISLALLDVAAER